MRFVLLPTLNRSCRIGVITPSTNTTQEPILCQILRGTNITAHYSRFPVRNISLDQKDLGQFRIEYMLTPARLLSHAGMDVIAWFGTAGGWLGAERDMELCNAITKATGVKAVTAMLSSLDAFRTLGVKTLGLVVPYERNLTQAIIENFARAGHKVVRDKHLGLRANLRFGSVPLSRIKSLVRQASRDVDAVSVFCTNFSAALVADEIEEETGTPVLDSINVTLWRCLQTIGIQKGIKGYGTLLSRNPKVHSWNLM